MKKLGFLMISLFFVAVSVHNAVAQNSASVSAAEANATIVTPITLTNNLTFELGELVKPSSGTGALEITASTTPSRNLTNGLSAIPDDTWRPAQFTVTGDDTQSFSITKDATITLDGPGDDDLTVTTSISGNTTGVTTVSGSYVFYIGGTMDVLSTQTAGSYTGTYQVSVAYE